MKRGMVHPKKTISRFLLGVSPVSTLYAENSLFYKISQNKFPFCLYELIPSRNSIYNTRNLTTVPLLNTKHSFFKNCLSSSVIGWNKLNPWFRNSIIVSAFKLSIFSVIRSSPNSVFNRHNSYEIKHTASLDLVKVFAWAQGYVQFWRCYQPHVLVWYRC